MPTIEEILILAETKGIDKAREDLDDLTKSTVKADDEGKKYTKTLGDMAGETQVFGVSLNGLSEGFKSSVGAIKLSTNGMKAFNLAMRASIIGIIVLALTSLVAVFTKTQKGMNLVEDGFAVLTSTVEVVIGVLVQLGESLLKLFSGDFSGAMSTASKAFENLGSRITESATATLNLIQAQRDLEDQMRITNITVANINLINARNKRSSDDITKSLQDRLKASRAFEEGIKSIAIEEGKIADESLRIARAEIALQEKKLGITIAQRSDENKQRISDALVEQVEVKIRAEERLIEAQNKSNQLEQEVGKERTERARIARLEANFTGLERQKAITDYVEVSKKGDKDIATSNLKLAKIQTGIRAQTLEEEIEVAEAKEQLLKATLNGIATALNLQGTNAKIFAIFQGTLDVALAVGKAIASSAWPANIPAIAVAVTAGANLIATIRGASQPQARSFGSGGWIDGPSHMNGGVMANLEGGESVINAKSSKMFRSELSAMNVAGGGVPFMQLGGVIPQTVQQASPFRDMELIMAQNRTVLVMEDFDNVRASQVTDQIVTTL